jgi:methyl-accepting chemotaxis protein
MSFLNNAKIGTKVVSLLMGMGLLAAGIAVYGSLRLKALDDTYSELITNQTGAALDIAMLNRDITNMGYGAYMAVAQDGASEQAKLGEALQHEGKAKAVEHLADAKKLLPERATEVAALETKLTDIVKLSDIALDHGVKDEDALAKTTEVTADQAVAAFIVVSKELRDELIKGVKVRSDEITAQNNQSMMLMIGGALLSTILMIAAGLMVSIKGITGPLNRLGVGMGQLAAGDLSVDVDGQDRRDEVGVMAKALQVFKDNALTAKAVEAEAERLRVEADAERGRVDAERRKTAADQAMIVSTLAASLGKLANGDLTARIDAQFDGQYAQIKTDFNAALESMSEAMNAIVSATGAIRGGSDEIASASDDLSRRTEQQAASLEETAAALDEITATVRRSADGAKQASEAATSAKSDAERSGSVVAEAVTAMGQIEESSAKITQIIGVIDEIAFQTNLLALNAGVEAARAGDAGRGFAVVASEVRALAQRSADAAKEIKALISSSAAQVERGVRLVGDTGEVLGAIASKVTEIDVLVASIAMSAQEQATGLNQVNTAVNQMDQVTQQNAAMVEEATAAATSLKNETVGLSSLIGRFHLDRTGAAAPGRAAQPRHPVHAAQQRAAQMISTDQAASDSWKEF